MKTTERREPALSKVEGRESAGQHQASPELVERGAAMKKGWQTKKLSDVCSIASALVDPRMTKYEDMLHVGGANIESATGKLVDLKTAKEEGLKSGKFVFDDSTVLYSKIRPYLMKVARPDFQGLCSADIYPLTPDPAVLDRGYLFHHLLSPQFTEFAVSGSARAGMPKVNRDHLFTFQFPVPPLAEQQRIVGLLDEAFEGLATAKANAEKNLQNARALFESHLQSVFTQRGPGWVEKKVSEIAKHSLGKMLDKAKNKGEPQPYLRNINVRWFTFDLSDLLQMPFLPTEVEKYTAIKGDVLICEGGYPGRAAIWDEDYPIYFQKALHRVRFHETELNKWFVYYLSVQDSSGQLKQHFSGTGIQHFTGEVLARFPIPVPPLPELRRAVAKFDALSEQTQRLARLYEQKLVALESLKKSLLHQAFTGEL